MTGPKRLRPSTASTRRWAVVGPQLEEEILATQILSWLGHYPEFLDVAPIAPPRIQCFSPEILIKIFTLLTQPQVGPPNYWNPDASMKDLVSLLLVCRSWSLAAAGAPQLWTDVVVHGCTQPEVFRQGAFARYTPSDKPLHLHLFVDVTVEAIKQLCLPPRGRWGSVTLYDLPDPWSTAKDVNTAQKAQDLCKTLFKKPWHNLRNLQINLPANIQTNSSTAYLPCSELQKLEEFRSQGLIIIDPTEAPCLRKFELEWTAVTHSWSATVLRRSSQEPSCNGLVTPHPTFDIPPGTFQHATVDANYDIGLNFAVTLGLEALCIVGQPLLKSQRRLFVASPTSLRLLYFENTDLIPQEQDLQILFQSTPLLQAFRLGTKSDSKTSASYHLKVLLKENDKGRPQYVPMLAYVDLVRPTLAQLEKLVRLRRFLTGLSFVGLSGPTNNETHTRTRIEEMLNARKDEQELASALG